MKYDKCDILKQTNIINIINILLTKNKFMGVKEPSHSSYKCNGRIHRML
jgi:hypothetical protein